MSEMNDYEKKLSKVRFLLVRKASGENYSVEAGLHDGKKNWDHHPGSWEDRFYNQPPSPANNPAIGMERGWGITEITHVDADTLMGIKRLISSYPREFNTYAGTRLEKKEKALMPGVKWDNPLNTDLIEAVDLNGSSILKEGDEMSNSYLFMVGVGALARELRFPRLTPGQESLDVTEEMKIFLENYHKVEYEGEIVTLHWEDFFTYKGYLAQKEVERAYQDCRVAEGDLNLSANSSTQEETRKGLWSVGPEDDFDPSRPYKDGVDIVVVYRSHYKSISVYCNPESIYAFGGKEVGGVLFAGHAKACGSPRGEEMTLEDARRVFESI